jgi:F0F1-type ATP synthase membrane subunit b/b'
MEFLQNLFGNLSSGVIRLAVTVGILAAVYFFLVKPILHTTEKTVESTNHQIEKSFEHSFEGANVNVKGIEENVNKTIEEVNKQVQTQVEHSFHTAKAQGGKAKTEKLLHCIQHAHQNVHRIEACSRRFS